MLRRLRWAIRRRPAAFLMLLAAAVRLPGIGDAPLWVDEGCSVWYARWTWAELWRSLPGMQQHPPLYFGLLHEWMAWGDGEGHLRLFSTLCSCLTVPVVYALGRTLASRRAATFGALLFALAPFSVRHAQEARMYSQWALESAVALWAAARISKEGGGRQLPWAAYVLGMASALYTHHASMLVLLVTNASFLALWIGNPAHSRPLARRWLRAQFAVTALWLPLIPGLLEQAGRVYGRFWIPAPTVDSALRGMLEIAGAFSSGGLFTPAHPLLEIGASTAAVIAAALCLAGLWMGRRHRTRTLLLGAAVVLPPIVLLAASALRPVFLPRLLLWTLAPAAVSAGLGLVRLRRPGVRWTLLALLAAGHACGYPWVDRTPSKEPWDWAARAVAMNAQPGDAVVFLSPIGQAPFDYYARRLGLTIAVYGAPSDMAESGSREPPVSAADVAALKARLGAPARVWLVCRFPRYVDPEGLARRAVERTGRRTLREVRDWIEVTRYDRGR